MNYCECWVKACEGHLSSEEDGRWITKQPVHQVCEYVNVARSYATRSCESDDFVLPPVLFRGQRHDWPLLPSIGRQPRNDFGHKLKSASGAEEAAMFIDFKRRATPFLGANEQPKCDLEWLALAQHSGLHTRLMDWTEDAMAALWFALDGGQDINDMRGPVVWILMPEDSWICKEGGASDKAPLSATDVSVVCPRQFTGRIRSQSAWFTLHSRHKGGFQPLQDSARRRALRKIKLAEGAVIPMRSQLHGLGLTASSIYPDLSGIVKRVNSYITVKRARGS